MELMDTHCHLGFDELAGDLDGVLARSKKAGVIGWVNVGTNTEENKKAVELAERYDGMYAAVGIHPHYAKDVTKADLEKLKELGTRDKVVAIGETGLDFHYNFSSHNDQERLFAKQLEIAAAENLPVIVHSREAFVETVEILERFGGGVKRVVFHCFSYSANEAAAILEMGYYISFTGVVTFKNAKTAREATAVVPIERLMIETDCPYMSPEPMRKQKVNEPGLMVYTARFLAELKGMEPEAFAEVVSGVSKGFFGLPIQQ